MEQLEHQLTAMLSKMEILEEKLHRTEKDNQDLEKDNQNLRSSISGSSDSQGGDTVKVHVQGEFKTPIPRAVGESNVKTVRSQTPAPSGQNQSETKKKHCDGTPNVSKVAAIIKDFRHALTLRDASQWEVYKHKISSVIAEQMMDANSIDIKKVWDPKAEESLEQRKKRVELYKIIVGTLGKEHAGKLESPSCVENMCDVSAVWKTLEKAFNEQYKKCNVGKIRRQFMAINMAECGLAVVEYRIELERRLQKLQDIGITIDVIIELIPHYLESLSSRFSSVVDYIRRSMREDPTRFDKLKKVGQEVEYIKLLILIYYR